ncbi:hypothetical protein Fmac_014586 [Flemingia macrophylla]|uniref:non-specific serine/threonine protein kinase n=1 Tax=Flemingia macrophylla TaxID=520843 RepID=A0ABD1MC55_9FABA
MANQMNSEIVGSIDMRVVDAMISFSERVDSLIKSETGSFYGDSPLYTFASRVDSAIRSSSASYEADNEAHNSTTTNVSSQTLTQQPHFHHLHQSKGLNLKDGRKEENGLNGLSRKVSSSSMLLTPQTDDEILQSSKLKRFTFKELKTATRSFRPDSLVGEDGFGSVFKGWIDDETLTPTKSGTRMAITVKRNNQDSLLGYSEWLTEIKYLGQLCHPNLVKLIGYASEDDHGFLVYEWMARGSLDNHLFRRAFDCETLSWTIRMKVALDAAKGLALLHGDEVHLIHRNVKTSNILLDSNYNAKLSDLMLARNGPEGDESHVSTRVMGSYGYVAPEYIATGRLTKKNDVYGFGVVLLELMSGKRVLDRNKPIGEYNLVEWAKPLLIDRKRISKVMDARIKGQYSEREEVRIAHLTIQCLSVEPKLRPTMDEMVRSLEHLQDTKDA